MADYASEAGHWYATDGTPVYEVQARDGSMRPTTLRDARRLNLVPSVTTIMQCAASPALESWKRDQLLQAALTLPRRDGEETDEFAKRIVLDSQEQANRARDIGTAIHACIEKCFKKEYDWDQTYAVHVNTTRAVLGGWCNGLAMLGAEKSFAHPLGFGGKVDAHKPGFVADFKTKDFGPEKLPETYDNHSWQLAAYRNGLQMPQARCAIVYVSTRVPGLVHLVEISQEELARGWEMFLTLLRFWQLRNRYEP